jgi:DnaK suppressor protein
MRSTGAISGAQLREIEADIRSELARIERSLENTVVALDGESLRTTPAFGADGELTATLTSRAHARSMELTEALQRMEEGRYGVCANCGSDIPYGRLLVVPEATQCLRCR